MSTSAAPMRSPPADHSDPAQSRSRSGRKSQRQKPSHPPSSVRKTKRRRLNDEPVAPGFRHPHRPLGPHEADDTARYETHATTSRLLSPPTQSVNAPANACDPNGNASKDNVRALRSKYASRPKSDLDKYFPDYEDVIRGESVEEDLFAPETLLHIIDKDTRTFKLPFRSPTNSPNTKRKRDALDQRHVQDTYSDKKEAPVQTKPMDLETLADQWEKDALAIDQDPLADSAYRGHRRAERQEKQVRNTDKERAMHEKSELERLLGDLRGPDWLRTLGISGITETQKRDLEPKRDIFIARVQGLLERFASWKERERELRLARETRLRQVEADESDKDATQGKASARTTAADGEPAEDIQRDRSCQSLRSPAPADAVPFHSFFRKRHQRAAAMEKHRRGRNVRAFGQRIPDMPDAVFRLPEDVLKHPA